MEFLTSTAGSLIIFVIGLAIFIALCFTKVPRIYAVLLAVLVFAFGINAEWTTSLFTTFLGGTVTVIQSYLFTTLSGAAVGCALAATGCANRIAETVMNLVGRQRGALVIMIVSFLVCASGALGHTWIVLPIALAVCRVSNIPRGVALLAYVSQVQIVQFSLVGIPGLPNLMPAEYLGTNIYQEPVMSIVGVAVAEVLCFLICEGFVRHERKRGNGFEVTPEIDFYKTPEERPDDEMPNIVISLIPLVIMIGGSILLNQVFKIASTPSAIIPQIVTIFFLLIVCRKYWQATIKSRNKMEELYLSMERAFPMIIVTGFIGGMGTLISSMSWYEVGINWAMNLQTSPYLLAFIVLAIICFITADGIAGMQLFLNTMSAQFIAIPESTWVPCTVLCPPPPARWSPCPGPPAATTTALISVSPSRPAGSITSSALCSLPPSWPCSLWCGPPSPGPADFHGEKGETMNQYPHLFQPLRVKNVIFRNRIFSSPHMLCYANWDGSPSLQMIKFFEEKAKGGCAMVTMGDTPVDEVNGVGIPRHIKLIDQNVNLLAELAYAIKKNGAVASFELNHPGNTARNPDGAARLGAGRLCTARRLHGAGDG